MYAHLDGIVAEKSIDTLVIDCGGVGYLLTVSSETLANAPAIGERMKVYTYLSVREDAMELFGFISREEKRMFERLKGVSGVGAKTALQILSALGAQGLSIALAAGDAASISRAPGVGKKTAQRLILELRDKVTEEDLTGGPAPRASARGKSGAGSIEAEAIEALMALGYQSSEAAQAVASIDPMPDRVDEVIRLALKGMVK